MTEEKQQIAEAPKHEAQGTILPPAPEAPDRPTATGTPGAPVPKRNHNRRPGIKRKPGPPKMSLSTEEQQQAITLAANGYPPSTVAERMGRSRLLVKRHLETPEVIAEVSDERLELVTIYREKARACVAAIDDEKIQKSSALQLATSSGILLDKSLILSGQPTSIHVHALVDILDLIKEQRDERERLEEEEDKAAKALLTPSAKSEAESPR